MEEMHSSHVFGDAGCIIKRLDEINLFSKLASTIAERGRAKGATRAATPRTLMLALKTNFFMHE